MASAANAYALVPVIGCTESHRIGACRASVSDAVGCVLSEDDPPAFHRNALQFTRIASFDTPSYRRATYTVLAESRSSSGLGNRTTSAFEVGKTPASRRTNSSSGGS